ncbi:Uncharacterised protein [Yersinia intermedia]|uniref:Transglycosylase SLT domain-containing protein n=2 Tax=Yersinia intermedia TaxID=631 RepID=A0A0T9N2Q1_YERIN|nr:Uncharacterised protein [Yersinia intermedia]
MSAMGRYYGLNTTEDRMDFNKSSAAAAKYLADLLKDFDDDVNKTVASYNWGQNNVKTISRRLCWAYPAIYSQSGTLAANTADINALTPASIASQ